MRIKSVVVAGAIVASSIFVPITAHADTRICGNPIYAGMAVSTCDNREAHAPWYPSVFKFGWVWKGVNRTYRNSDLPRLEKVGTDKNTWRMIQDSFNKAFP
jgi:hypothetical protein